MLAFEDARRGSAVLTPVCGLFTEEADATDVQEARVVLAGLAG